MGDKDSGWYWYASSDGEYYPVGPCDTRDEVIREAFAQDVGWMQDGQARIEICEARNDPLRLADWIGAEATLERADEGLWDSDRVSSEYDDGPIFWCAEHHAADLVTRLKAACDEWQAANGLAFTASTFSAQRSREVVAIAPDGSEVKA